MRKRYFKPVEDAPAPLRHTGTRRVRFDEVDMMGIVWNGRYASYFEDGRVALGGCYGISYVDFIRESVPVPLRRLTIDYHHPLRFGEEFEIDTLLHWSDAARINFEYTIRNAEGMVTCTGCSIQLMLNTDFDLLLAPPPFFQDFLDRWKRGELT